MEILIVEAMTLHDGLLVIPNTELQKLIVEGDSKTLIDVVNGKIDRPW